MNNEGRNERMKDRRPTAKTTMQTGWIIIISIFNGPLARSNDSGGRRRRYVCTTTMSIEKEDLRSMVGDNKGTLIVH